MKGFCDASPDHLVGWFLWLTCPFPCFSNDTSANHNPRAHCHSGAHWDALWLNSVSLSLEWSSIFCGACKTFDDYGGKRITYVLLFSDYYWEQFDKNVTKRNMIGKCHTYKRLIMQNHWYFNGMMMVVTFQEGGRRIQELFRDSLVLGRRSALRTDRLQWTI